MSNFSTYLENINEIGFVEEVQQTVVKINGLPGAQPHEMVCFETGEVGLILSLAEQYAEALVFTKKAIRVGTAVARTNQILQVPVGTELLGKTISPLGYSLDQNRPIIRPQTFRPVEMQPSGIASRKRIKQVLSTGLSIVDLLVPLGRGQRQLVVGDRKTGKTSFLLQTLLNQAREGTVCIYAAIGKKKIDIKTVEELLDREGVLEKSLIVAATIEDPAGMIYLAPYAAMTIAEFFRDQGKDVLLILDDLSTHARFYREISLLSKRFPGRNSYPGDIFYTHARLLERAGNFILPTGEASISCLAVAETQIGDLSGYIQTNLMSMTDGHIFFDNNLFAQGRRPAINPFLSVTRVGRQTQTDLRRQISRELISFLTLFDKMQNFSHFGAEATSTIKHTLTTGEKIYAFFDHGDGTTLNQWLQVYIFCMIWSGIWEASTIPQMKQDIAILLNLYNTDQSVSQLLNTTVDEAASLNALLHVVYTQAPEILAKAKQANLPSAQPPMMPQPTQTAQATTPLSGQ